jgi:hypothetical protein
MIMILTINISTDSTDWLDAPTEFDVVPTEFQVLYDWVVQGALDN